MTFGYLLRFYSKLRSLFFAPQRANISQQPQRDGLHGRSVLSDEGRRHQRGEETLERPLYGTTSTSNLFLIK